MKRTFIKKAVTVVLAGVIMAETVTTGCPVIATADSEYSSEDLSMDKPLVDCIDNVFEVWGKIYSDAEGVQLQWSYKADFSNATTTSSVRPAHSDGRYTVKIESPEPNRTIHCRVRGYITKDGRKVYGEWSKKNSLKIIKLQKPEQLTLSNVKSKTIHVNWKKVQAVKGMKVRYIIFGTEVGKDREEIFWLTNKTSINIKNKAFGKGKKVAVYVGAYVQRKNYRYWGDWDGYNMMYGETKTITMKK